MKQFVCVAIVMLITSIAQTGNAQSIVSDTVFPLASWNLYEILDLSGTGSCEAHQHANGHPGRDRQIGMSMNSQSGYAIGSTFIGGVYVPDSQGTIGFLSGSFDMRFDTLGGTHAQTLTFTIMQPNPGNPPDSFFYSTAQTITDTLGSFIWATLHFSGLTADSFTSTTVLGSHPNFSVGGLPIHFGMTLGYTAPQPGGSFVYTSIDNFQVRVYHCSGDPFCDAIVNIQDVIATVDVAFRSGPSTTDPGCNWERSDVNCDGATGILDVVRVVNVAFRGADAATEFCDPCP